MNTIMKTRVAVIGLMLAAASLSAQTTATNTYTSSAGSATIFGGSVAGTSQVLSINNTTFGTIQSLTVSLNIAGGNNGSLYAYLVDPAGDRAILLNRVGVSGGDAFGYSDAGLNITLNVGGNNVHSYQSGSYTLSGGVLTGTWGADGRNIDPQSSGSAFDSASTSSGLNLFTGVNLNGNWTLFVSSVVGGTPDATLNGWGMTIVSTPEPSTLALATIGGVGVLVLVRRRK